MAVRECLTALALLATPLAASSAAFAQEDLVAAGEKVFRKCQACHAVGEGAANKVGPQLNALFGRKPGSLPDYKYSEAMVAFGQDKVWDEATLTPYLENPRGVVKGTKMVFPGLKKPEEIQAVLAYLATFDPEGLAMR
jgi:cytochrome c